MKSYTNRENLINMNQTKSIKFNIANIQKSTIINDEKVHKQSSSLSNAKIGLKNFINNIGDTKIQITGEKLKNKLTMNATNFNFKQNDSARQNSSNFNIQNINNSDKSPSISNNFNTNYSQPNQIPAKEKKMVNNVLKNSFRHTQNQIPLIVEDVSHKRSISVFEEKIITNMKASSNLINLEKDAKLNLKTKSNFYTIKNGNEMDIQNKYLCSGPNSISIENKIKNSTNQNFYTPGINKSSSKILEKIDKKIKDSKLVLQSRLDTRIDTKLTEKFDTIKTESNTENKFFINKNFKTITQNKVKDEITDKDNKNIDFRTELSKKIITVKSPEIDKVKSEKKSNKLASYFNQLDNSEKMKLEKQIEETNIDTSNNKLVIGNLKDYPIIGSVKKIPLIKPEISEEGKKKGHQYNSSQPQLRPLVNINFIKKNEKIEIKVKEKEKTSVSPESTWNKVSTKDPETFDMIDPNKSFESNLSKIRENLFFYKESLKLAKYISTYYSKNQEYPNTELNFYKIGRFLGKGAFGKVNLGLHVLTGRLVAIKSLNKKKIDLEKLKRKITFETNILKSLHHTNIVKIYETFETEKFYMISMEYISCGDLLNYVKKRSKLTENIAKFIYKQIIKAVMYIHSKSIAHRDIKLDNILIDINSNIKLCDFGVSKKLEKNVLLNDQCGTPAYIAPEVFRGQGYDGTISDVWSTGVVLYAMLSGTVPFKAPKLPELQKIVMKGTYNKIKGLSPECEDLFSKVLNIDPKLRITCIDILNHPWMDFDEYEFRRTTDLFTEAEKIHLSNSNLDYRNCDPNLICEAFTYKNLDTIVKCENNKSKSIILAPFNSSLNDIDYDPFVNYITGFNAKSLSSINYQQLINENYFKELDVLNGVIKFDAKVKVLNKIYEMNNNGEIDNGIVISPKILSKNNSFDSDKEEQAKKKYMSNINSKINSKLNSIINSPMPEKEKVSHNVISNFFIKMKKS